MNYAAGNRNQIILFSNLKNAYLIPPVLVRYIIYVNLFALTDFFCTSFIICESVIIVTDKFLSEVVYN